ncbi:hypothetical protein CASFOL_042194 [Castilleja foliolosa]|uniref:Uncharacterized protein n=1 Tax=Castilleja foliolosa TaxID=1961234 RepID=A0ABD3B9S8_9LAMI
MKTNIAKMKCKSSSKIETKDERKCLKVLLPAIATKGLKTMNSMAKEESCFKKCVTAAINYHIKQMEVEKATNNSHSRSEIGPANQRDNKSPIKQFTIIEKGACSEMEREGQESCLAAVSIAAAHESQDELLPEKIVQDGQVLREEMMDTVNHAAAQDEKSSGKNKEMEISKDLKARKAELKQLKQETTMLSQELQRQSTMCMHLVDENKLLMDELKKMCDPRVIEILEAKDPQR